MQMSISWNGRDDGVRIGVDRSVGDVGIPEIAGIAGEGKETI
jgi:hypothetical protein